jgi:hypothetical protein
MARNDYGSGWQWVLLLCGVCLCSYAAHAMGVVIQGNALGAVFFFVPPVILAWMLNEEGY